MVWPSLADPTAPTEDAWFGPTRPTRADLVPVTGTRWVIAEGIAAATGEGGRDKDRVRPWVGRHRHGTRRLMAYASAVTRVAGAERGRRR